LFWAGTIPLSGALADRVGRMPMLIAATLAILAFGFVIGGFFAVHDALRVVFGLSLGLACMGLTYGPLGTALSELFPTAVRYTGSSLTFNLAGIFGASLAPYAATWLAKNYGLRYVGYYLILAAVLTLLGLLGTREKRDHDRTAAV